LCRHASMKQRATFVSSRIDVTACDVRVVTHR
jgi:hypothetical protein